jgi:hypothetical protein
LSVNRKTNLLQCGFSKKNLEPEPVLTLDKAEPTVITPDKADPTVILGAALVCG